jgi:hypothetical protein
MGLDLPQKNQPMMQEGKVCLNSVAYQQRKMLFLGYKYLQCSLRGHRPTPPTAGCLASLWTVIAAASRLQPLCTQLLTHNLLGSRRKPALCLSCPFQCLPARGQAFFQCGAFLHMTRMRALPGAASWLQQFLLINARNCTSERVLAFVCTTKTRQLTLERMQLSTVKVLTQP